MPAYPKESIPSLAAVVEDVAEQMPGQWTVLIKPGKYGRFLSDGRRLLHFDTSRNGLRLMVQGVDPKHADQDRVTYISALTYTANLAVHRGPEAIAREIETRLLPGYEARLTAAAERAEARAEALRTQEYDIERLLNLVESGQVRTSYLDARLVSWMIGSTNASAAIYLRREPDTIELTLQQVPLPAVRPIAEAVRGILEGLQPVAEAWVEQRIESL